MGFHISGATGSGILVARLPDGTWSPPSGIQVHALGAGLMIGVDIYDCVCVINSREALSAFMHTRVSLGPEVAVAAGPYGAGGGMEFGAARTPRSDVKQGEVKGDKTAAPTSAVPAHAGEGTSSRETDQLKPDKGHHRRSSSSALKPVFSYVKSRGFYAGVQIDGTVVTERKEANAEFYGENVSVDQILKGDVSPQEDHKLWPGGAKVLVDALNRAQDRKPEEVIVSGTDPSLPVVSVTSPSTASQDLPPPYVDDGRPHPGVGDQKVTYG
jgi:lipid-binding SYLF domain-containing protein